MEKCLDLALRTEGAAGSVAPTQTPSGGFLFPLCGMLSREFRSLIPDFIRLSSSIFPALDAGSIKLPSVFHLKSLRVEFAINPVMFAVLGNKQLRVVRQTHVRPVVVERSRIAV